MFSIYKPILNMFPVGLAQFWPHGLNLNKFGRCPLNDATYRYQDSRPCGVRQEDFFMFSLYKLRCKTCGAGPYLTPGVLFEQTWSRSTRYLSIIKTLGFVVSDKKIFSRFPYISLLNILPPERGHFLAPGVNLNKLGRGP